MNCQYFFWIIQTIDLSKLYQMYINFNFIENFYYKFFAMPLVIRIAIITAIFFIFLLLFYATLSVGSYNKKKIKHRKEEKRKNNTDCYRVLEDILVRNDVISFALLEHHFKSIQARCHLETDDLIYEMLALKNEFPKKFNYQNNESLSKLFNLTPYWDTKLTDASMKVKMENLQNIIDLRATISESVLSTLVYHKNSELRKKARIAQIHLSQHEPFKFFDEEFDKDFTVWDKIKIHDILLSRSIQTIPNFIRWIPKVKNENLLVMFIYEIGFYNQSENKEFLFDFFKMTPSEAVKIQIVETLKILGIEGLVKDLITQYHACSENVQLAIINNLKNIKNDISLLPFYISGFHKAYEIDLKLALGKAIYSSEGSGLLVIEDLEQGAEGFDFQIFEHIKNPLLLN